jgi:hypothetical protein
MLQTALFGIKLAELEENKGVNDSSRSERGPTLAGLERYRKKEDLVKSKPQPITHRHAPRYAGLVTNATVL